MNLGDRDLDELVLLIVERYPTLKDESPYTHLIWDKVRRLCPDVSGQRVLASLLRLEAQGLIASEQKRGRHSDYWYWRLL